MASRRASMFIQLVWATAAAALFLFPGVARAQAAPADDLQKQVDAAIDQKNCTAALQLANQIVKAAPSAAPGYIDLGRAQLCAGNAAAALKAFTQATTVDPTSRWAFENKASLENQLGRFADAATDAQAAIKIDKNAIFAYQQLGHALLGQEDLYGARDAYQQLYTIDQNDRNVASDAALNMCSVYARLADPNDAFLWCEKAKAILGENESVTGLEGRIYVQLGDFNDAVTSLNKCLALNAKSSFCTFWTAQMQFGQKNYPAASQTLDTYDTLNAKDANSALLRARIAQAQGDTASAIKFAQQAAQLAKTANDSQAASDAAALLKTLGATP